jgi:hypothetical protein
MTQTPRCDADLDRSQSAQRAQLSEVRSTLRRRLNQQLDGTLPFRAELDHASSFDERNCPMRHEEIVEVVVVDTTPMMLGTSFRI